MMDDGTTDRLTIILNGGEDRVELEASLMPALDYCTACYLRLCVWSCPSFLPFLTPFVPTFLPSLPPSFI